MPPIPSNPAAALRLPSSLSSTSITHIHPKPHLAAFVQRYQAAAASSSTSSTSSHSSASSSRSSTPNTTSSSSSTTPKQRPTTPTAPQLPPRRRPTFAAVGFGNGGSHPDAVKGRSRGGNGNGNGNGSEGYGNGNGSARPPGRDVNAFGSRLRASIGSSSGSSSGPGSRAVQPGISGSGLALDSILGRGADPTTTTADRRVGAGASAGSSSVLHKATDALPRPVASALATLGIGSNSTSTTSDQDPNPNDHDTDTDANHSSRLGPAGQGINSSPTTTTTTPTTMTPFSIASGTIPEMTKEEEEKVDGNEAEACYVPPPATLYYHHPQPLPLLYSSSPLPHFDIAYETWGTLNPTRSNAILLHTGLSASSHVASGGNDVSDDTRSKKGWWEDFVGPGKSIDTDKFFVVCTNVVGGCFGSTGPSSQWPDGEDGERWATRFPMLSLFDMLRAQLGLLDHLGIDKLYASIGASMGGMQSLALAYLAPERVGRLASISAAGRAGLNGVGMRYAQRSVLMNDPNWNRGFYYDAVPPHTGMKLARQIATITYRSGPEWEERFGRRMLSEREDGQGKKVIGVPSLSPDFLIETYLDHQGERFCLTYDANTMIYLSKAMDLFDMTDDVLVALSEKFASAYPEDDLPFPHPNDPPTSASGTTNAATPTEKSKFIPTSKSPHLQSLANGLKRLKGIPSLVLGVQSDVLFPVEQQRELADALKLAGNQRVTYYEIGGVWGHDTFLLDVQGVGGAIRGFLQWAD